MYIGNMASMDLTPVLPREEDLQNNKVQNLANIHLAPDNTEKPSLKRKRTEGEVSVKKLRPQPSFSLEDLPTDLLTLIGKHLGIEVLSFAHVNRQLNAILQQPMFNQLNIGHKSLVKIMQLGQQLVGYGQPLPHELSIPADKIHATILLLAQTPQQDWIEQLHKLYPLDDHIVSPEQFQLMINSNMKVAISYLSLLSSESLNPKNREYRREYVRSEEVLKLMAKLLPYAEKTHCLNWLPQLADQRELLEEVDLKTVVPNILNQFRDLIEEKKFVVRTWNPRDLYHLFASAYKHLKGYPELLLALIKKEPQSIDALFEEWMMMGLIKLLKANESLGKDNLYEVIPK